MTAPRRNPVDRMSPAELVSLSAGISETKAIWLLDQIGGLPGLYRAGTGELVEIIGHAPAVRLRASIELGTRMIEEMAKPARPILDNPEWVQAWAAPKLLPLDYEELWVLALDGRHGLRAAKMVARGGVHGLHVGVRDVLRIALREGASGFVMVHNHPSGDPSPSDEDIAFTRSVAEASKGIGTPLLDHVIVAKKGYTSFKALGLMPSTR